MKRLYFAAFVTGAAIGSVVTWYCVKKKYEKIAQEEIDSVKEVFAKKESAKAGEKADEGLNRDILLGADRAKNKPDLREYAAIIQNAGYASYSDRSITEKKEALMKQIEPYVITPEEFGEFDDYEKISLTYYADGVLTDDEDEIIEDVEDIVGDALDHFGEYEEDSVFARCEERKCDYEILLDQREYSEVAASKPHRVEVQ